MKRKKTPSTTDRAKLTWSDIIAAFEQELLAHGRSAATVDSYASTMRAFGQFYTAKLGKSGPYVSRLQSSDLHDYIDYLRQHRQLATASVNSSVSALRSFVRWAIRHKWMRRNIASELRTYQAFAVKKTEPLRSVEVQRLLGAPDPNGRNGLRDHALLQLFVQTGVRLGELAALSVGDVTLRKTTGKLLIRGDDTRSDRTVRLNGAARAALHRFLKSRGEPAREEPLFVSERGRRLAKSSVHHLVKKYLCFAGRNELSARALRHHFVAELYRKTGKLTAVKQALGRRSVVTSVPHERTSARELAEGIEALAENLPRLENQA